jgi:hypothetical protein
MPSISSPVSKKNAASAAEMKNIPASAVTELKLRTDFILDRKKFLDDVCDAVMYEEEPGPREMLRLIVENNYASVIARIIAGTATGPERQKATWALATLLGSDQKVVRESANKACVTIEDAIFENLTEPDTPALQMSAAYLMFNWATRFSDNEMVDERLLRLFEDGFVEGITKVSVRVDLMEAVRAALSRTRAGHTAARKVVERLGSADGSLFKRERALLLEAFSEICSEDGSDEPAFAPEDHAVVFDLFEKLLTQEGLTTAQRADLTFALSNFVVEPHVADKFFTRWALRNEMVVQCEDVHRVFSEEACWVLANAIAKATWTSTHADVGTDYGLRYALCAVEASCKKGGALFKAIHEALDKLSEWEALYAPLEPESESDSESVGDAAPFWEEASKIDWENPGTWGAISSPGPASEVAAPEVAAPEITVATVESPLPSAMEMLIDPAHRNGSAALRGLVHALKLAGPTAWVPVPAGTMLSIEDLTLVGMLGYTIAGGQFGINPYMSLVRAF